MSCAKLTRTLLALFLMAFVLGANPLEALAKGGSDKLVIYGDEAVMETSDSSLLTFDALSDFAVPYPGTPSVFNPGYLIVRYGLDQRTGEYVAIDSFRYFPPDEIQPKAFVYYEGLTNGWSEYDAKWYEARAGAVTSLQALFDRPVPEPPGLLRDLPGLVLASVAGLVVGAASTWLASNRRTDPGRAVGPAA